MSYFVLILILILSACGGFGSSDSISDGVDPLISTVSEKSGGVTKEWTYMVYMAADSDLSASAVDDMLEMMSVGSSDSVSVVVQAEFSPKFSPEIKDYDTYRFYVEKGDIKSIFDSSVSIENVDMTNPEELNDFIKWTAKHFPAKHYALVIWSHGDGWIPRVQTSKSSIIDETSAPNNSMSNADMARAIADSGIHIDVLDFDACYMGMYEVLYDFKGSADYFVASAGSVPGDGLPYDQILERITKNPKISPKDLAIQTVDLYYANYVGRTNGNLTLTAFDMNRFGEFDQKFRSLIGILSDYISDLRSQIESIQNRLIAYPAKSSRDMIYFIEEVAKLDCPELSASANELKSIYSSGGMILNHRDNSGLSSPLGFALYFPKSEELTDSLKYEYSTLTVNQTNEKNWNDFLFSSYFASGR